MNETLTKPQNETCVEIKKSAISDILMSVYILNFIFGLIFNVLTIFPILKQVKQQNILGVFLLCLSFSDLLFIGTMPLWINYYNKDHKWALSVASCSVIGFFYYSNMYISIYLLCCISVDRCLVVCYPLRFKTHRTSLYAWLQCGIVYVGVTVLHVLVLVNDNLKDAHDEKKDTCYETYPMEPPVAKFNLLRVVFGFLLPLVVLAVCYWRILTTVGQSPGLSAQAKRKVRLLSYGVIIIFSICFAPYHILLLIRSVVYFYINDSSYQGSYCKFEQGIHFYFSCTLALSSLNSVADPVLYVLATNGVKEKLQLCRRGRGSRLTEGSAVLAQNGKKHTVSSLI